MPASTHRDRDFYDILGVNRTATDLDIKKAFKRLALTWHPDKNPGDKVLAERKFKEITEAYEVLSDRRRREVYDTYGKDYERRSSPHCPHCRTSCCCRDTYTCQQAKKVYREFFGKSSPLTSQGYIPNPYSVPVFTVPSCNASNAWSPPSTSSTGLHSWEGSSGGKGRGFSFQSVTSSVHIVKGRQVLVTRVVEDGIETVTVEEEGVIVSKTVNGVPQRIGSPTMTKNLRSCGTGPCSDDPPPWASTVSTAAQEAAQNARSVRVQTEELPINSNEEPNEAWASGYADKKYTSASVSVSTNEEESQDCAASGPEQLQLGAPHAQSSKGICTVADAPPDPVPSLCMHSHRIAEEVAPGPSREQVDPEGASDVSSSPSHTNISSSDLGCRHRIRRGLRRCVHRSVSTSSSKGSLTGSDVRLAPPVSKRSNRPISIRGFKNATIPTYLKSRVRHIPSAPITRLFSVQGSASCYYEERTESSGNLPRCRVTPPPQGSQDSLEFVAIRRHKSRDDLLSRTEADCSQEKSRNPPISAFAELDVLDSQGRDSSSVFGSQRSLLSIEVHSCGGCDNLLAEDEWFSSPLSCQETDEFNVRRYSSVPHILQIDNPNPRRSASLHSPGPTIRQFLNEIEMASLVVGGRHGVINNTTAVEEIHSSDLNATKTRQSTFGIDDLKNKHAQQHGNIHDQTSSTPALIPKTPSEEGPLRTSSPPWSSSHLHDLPSYMATLTGAPTPASSLDDAEPETVSPNDLISIVPTLALSRIPMPPCHSEEEKSDRNQPQSSEDFPTAYIASAADVKKYAPLQEAAASEALDDDVSAAFVAPAKNGGAFPLGQSFSSLLFEGIHCQALFSPRWSNSTDTSTSLQISIASPGSAEDNDGFQENSISGSVTEDCTSAALTSLTSNPALKQSEESTAPLSVIEICEESEGEMLTPQSSISGQMNSVERLGPEQTHNVHKISGIDMPTPQSTVTIATHSKSKETVGKSKETSENKKSTGDMLIPHSPINRQKSDTEYVQEHKASLKKKSQGDMLTPQPSTTTQGKSLESMGQSLKPKTKKKSAGDMLTPQSSSTDEKFPTDTTGKRVMATTAASKGVAQTFAPASTANVRSDRLTRQISEKNIVVEPTDRATQTVQTSSTSVFAFWRKKKILDLETTERKSQAGMSGTTEGAGSNRNLSKFCVIL